MLTDAFKTLEFDKILARLRDCATSNFGKELAEKLQPADDFENVRESLSLTTEAVRIFAVSSPPLGGFRDVRETFKKIRLGSVADAPELLDVLSTMYTMRQVKVFFKQTEIDAPQLKSRATELEILGNLERQLDTAIDEHGTVHRYEINFKNAVQIVQDYCRNLHFYYEKILDQISKYVHPVRQDRFFLRNCRYIHPVSFNYRVA